MTMKIQQGTLDEIGLAFAPLSKVSEQLAAVMQADGTDRHCGMCHKPFNAARKQRGIVRVTHIGESGLMCSTWLLCGACKHTAKRNGGKVPASLVASARKGYEALRLMQAPAGGNA